MRRSVWLGIAVVVALAALGLVQSSGMTARAVAPQPVAARVRVLHAVPGGPALDVAATGLPPLVTDVTFKTLTDYQPVPPGTYTVTVVTTLGGMPLITRTATISGGMDYTFAVYGALTGTGAPLELRLLADDNSVPPVGEAKARFAHFVPGAPPVDVAIHDGPALFSGVSYGQVTPYVELPAGTYNVDLIGEISGIPVTIPVSVTAGFNTVYSFFAVGLPLSPDIVRSTDQQYVRVRGFHGMADAPPVDLWLDGTQTFSDVAYKELTAYAAVMSGTYTLGLAPVGAPLPILTATMVLTGGMDLTVAAAGTLTDTDAYLPELVPYVDNNAPPAAGDVKVRFIDLIPDASATVTVVLTDTLAPLFTNLTYREATAYAVVPAATYDVRAYLGAGPVPAATVSNTTFLDGVIYTAFGVGLANGPAPAEVVVTPSHRVWMPLTMRAN